LFKEYNLFSSLKIAKKKYKVVLGLSHTEHKHDTKFHINVNLYFQNVFNILIFNEHLQFYKSLNLQNTFEIIHFEIKL